MMRRKTKTYKAELLTDLRNLDYAGMYLSAAYDDSTEAFNVALRDVAEAQKGMAKLASEAQVNRENLYRMLSGKGNARERNLFLILRKLGLKLEVKPIRPSVRHSGQSAAGARILQSTRTRRSATTEQLALPFVAAGYSYSQPSASGMGTLTINAGPFTANAAVMVASFGSTQSSMQGEAERYFSLGSGQGHSHDFIRSILSVGNKTKREEADPGLIPNYAFQLPKPHVPLSDLTH
jgi:probable addiction module antidote protein